MVTRYSVMLCVAAVLVLAVSGAMADDYVFPIQNDDANLPGVTVSLEMSDFDATFMYSHQFVTPPWKHEWERFAFFYRGSTPDTSSAGSDSAANLGGGFGIYLPPRGDNAWGFILKDPAANNVILSTKVSQGIAGIDWAQPQQVRVRVQGDRHQLWVNGNVVWDYINGSGNASGYITIGNWIGGDTVTDLQIFVPEPGGLCALGAGLLSMIGLTARKRR